MRIPYHQQHKTSGRSGKTSRKLLYGTLLTLVLLLLMAVSADSWRTRAYGLFAHASTFRNSAALELGVFSKALFGDKEEIVRENTRLKKEVERLRKNEFVIESLSRENRALRDFFKIEETETFRVFPVTMKPPFVPDGMVVLDTDQNSNVGKGDLVLDSEGFALGEVFFHKGGFAKVVLFSAAGREVRAVTESGEAVLLLGEGGGNFYVELPKGFSVEEEDIFYLPSGEVLAQVSDVDESKNNPFVEVRLKSVTNVNSISHVAVKVDG